MSSHREAPEIASDPAADNTDVYAFVSPDKPDTVTLIANYVPLQGPAGGPNFYNFGDDVLYEIHISNGGTADSDIAYQFHFTKTLANPSSFLYNTGPIASLDDANWNLRQHYTVSKVQGGQTTVLANDLACPPCRIGPRSTPKYEELATAAIHTLPGGEVVFAGQRADPFWVDLGSIFDLGDLRPFQNLHLIPTAASNGVNGLKGFNVHTIAIQLPITAVTRDGSRPMDRTDARATIGVWASASRQKATMRGMGQTTTDMGPWVQVSRLGNPLINEVIIPLKDKDRWNTLPPADDKQFAPYYAHPGLAALLPGLYPGVFPNLAALVKSGKPRVDLEAILLTGIPAGIIPGFQNNTGSVLSDMLRLNTAIKPSAKPNILGLLGGDLAGFPNGRRVFDDVVTVELRAVAGLTYALVDKSFKPDAAAGAVTDGLTPASVSAPYLSHFPYLGVPY
ncbi:MAG: DUF4331 domain-containing protein, partial [Chloroflexi bacterium]|nr:DUF4331 domain-containing protein [Chloroflexota bacterium]